MFHSSPITSRDPINHTDFPYATHVAISIQRAATNKMVETTLEVIGVQTYGICIGWGINWKHLHWLGS